MAEEESVAKKIQDLKEKNAVQFKGAKGPIQYTMIYDSFGEGLEPIYYWALDFLRNLGYKVDKTADYFAAAEGSGYYGDMAIRRQALEKRVTELMISINAIVKSIINLLWDLKEFDIVLESYKNYEEGSKSDKEEAENALKAKWLTEVDMKKQRGSINLLTQDLNFVTLRDAFMVAKQPEDVEGMDLNDRVKRVLKPRVSEFLSWVKLSHKELKQRRTIEKAYLKSQVASLKVYTRWVKPYLIATEKLLPPEFKDIADAEDMVTAFDVARIYINLLGVKEIKNVPLPGNITKEFIPLREEDKTYAAIEVEFLFRSSPEKVGQQGGHFGHRGKTQITFKAYVYSDGDIKKLKELENTEVLQFIENMTDASLKAMHDDIDKYLKEDEPKEEAKPFELELPFISDIGKMIEKGGKLIEKKNKKPVTTPRREKWTIERLRGIAEETAEKNCRTIYEVFKKERRMLAW